MKKLCLTLLVVIFGAATGPAAAAAPRKTENVIILMIDGLRWQEVFAGAEEALLDHEFGGVQNKPLTRELYWRKSVRERRETLMPFLWSTIAKDGILYGNRAMGSEMSVTNGLNFSYPGYSETLCGFVDPKMDNNEKTTINPNVTVLEWLHAKPAFKGRVAAFTAWDAFPSILNAKRCGFPINAGYDAMTSGTITPGIMMLNTLKTEIPRTWAEEPPDAFPFRTAMEYMEVAKPRILFISLGETDEYAHHWRYDEYLNSAHRADDFASKLWERAQSMEEYRGKTTLLILPDHGRGNGLREWTTHGKDVTGSEATWLAVLGPDTLALGERKNGEPVFQDQIAATVAALVGEDYVRAVTKAGKPLKEVLGAGGL